MTEHFSFGLSQIKQVWFIPFVDKRVGVQIKLCDPLTTRAILERFCDEDVRLLS